MAVGKVDATANVAESRTSGESLVAKYLGHEVSSLTVPMLALGMLGTGGYAAYIAWSLHAVTMHAIFLALVTVVQAIALGVIQTLAPFKDQIDILNREKEDLIKERDERIRINKELEAKTAQLGRTNSLMTAGFNAASRVEAAFRSDIASLAKNVKLVGSLQQKFAILEKSLAGRNQQLAAVVRDMGNELTAIHGLVGNATKQKDQLSQEIDRLEKTRVLIERDVRRLDSLLEDRKDEINRASNSLNRIYGQYVVLDEQREQALGEFTLAQRKIRDREQQLKRIIDTIARKETEFAQAAEQRVQQVRDETKKHEAEMEEQIAQRVADIIINQQHS